MANPDLPQEILLEIFSRIPAKSVGKCRTLSKSWNTHLSTKSFIKKHLISRKQTIQQQNLFFTSYSNPKVYMVTSPTKKDELLQIIDFTSQWLRGVGSCDGLVWLNGSIFFNPITRKQVTIRFPEFTRERHLVFWDYVDGFGYDSCSDDYKIVRLSSYKSNIVDKLPMTFVSVYSVKNGVWKRLDGGCYPYGEFVPRRYAFQGGAFVNGSLHWLICSKEGYRSCIAAFDLANEVFSEIPLPKGFVRQLRNDVSASNKVMRSNGLSVVGECLLIVDNLGNGATDVWIMEEYGVGQSWVKSRIQSEEGDYKWDKIVATLCYVEAGELMCLTSGDFLFACDLKGGTVRRVVLGECEARFASGVAFVDSLVSPEGSL